jgi:two-component system, OmpR family, sensor kinase
MSRLPIRWRLTLVFALAMAAVLVAVGAFLYVRLGNTLEEQLDESLQARVDDLGAVEGGGLAGGDESFAQVLGPEGAVRAASPGFTARAVLTPAELVRARDGRVVVERELAGEPYRVLAEPRADGGIAVAGGSLEERDEALAGLLAQLLVAGPLALLLAAAAGYLLAGAALRPVEAMRRRADEISAATAGTRLPLPEAQDEVRRLGETLNAMLERLDEGLQRERRFVADASHELRTPLAVLSTELELALRRPRSPEELESALRSAAEEVDRLVRLSEDLLVLAATQDGRLPVRRAVVPAGELLDAVAGRFAARAAADGRALEVDAPPGESLLGDRLRLEQALGNLVDNALRHGGGTVRLDAVAANSAVVLGVSDDGAGFPPDFLPRAFERFSRADEARAGYGAGLGLPIVQTIARAHGGEARAANDAGGGARVTISLPAD